MADMEEAPANATGEPTAAAPELTPSDAPQPAENPVQLPPDSPSEDPTTRVAKAPIDEPPFLAADIATELPEELRVVHESLEQPTGEIAPDTSERVGAEPPVEASESAESAEGEPAESAEGEPAESADSLDDIAPGTIATAAETKAAAVSPDRFAAPPITKVSWWPFVAYIVVWLGAAGYAVWQLRLVPVGKGVYETNLYSMSMVAGLGLLAAGPALLLIVWLGSLIGRKDRRIGAMFISALVKGATATLIGAIIWIAAIMLTDYLRLGRPF